LARNPVTPANYWSVANHDLTLQPGRERVESAAAVLFDEPSAFTVHGTAPHMHQLGRTLRVEAQAAGESRCLVDVDRWDFHWQNAWFYDEPLVLDNVRQLSIRCSFDTRGQNEVVTWGDRSSDEMCINYLYVTTDDEQEARIACDNADNPLIGSCLDALVQCYQPNRAGTCSEDSGAVSWSDGSRVAPAGEGAGIYGAGQSEPCVSISTGADGIVLHHGNETLRYVEGDRRVDVTCGDGSKVAATRLDLREFGVCRGLACAP